MDILIIIGAQYVYLAAVLITGIYFLLHQRKKVVVFFAVADLLIVYIAGLLASTLYYNPRPFVSEHITPLISHAADNGFPSDHTLLAAALASIVFCFNRKLGIVLFAIALLVGTARVLAGIHHWIDIVGSFVIVTVVTVIVYQLSKKRLFI